MTVIVVVLAVVMVATAAVIVDSNGVDEWKRKVGNLLVHDSAYA